MKSKIRVLGIFWGIACVSAAQAQEGASSRNRQVSPATYRADIVNIQDSGVNKFTSKYDGMNSAQVQFDRQTVRLLVYKNSAECPSSSLCNGASGPMIVTLEVKGTAASQCHDSYYARTPSNVKSAVLEEVLIHRFASERCQQIAEGKEGSLEYRISGISNASGIAGTAIVYADLDNVKAIPLRNTTQP